MTDTSNKTRLAAIRRALDTAWEMLSEHQSEAGEEITAARAELERVERVERALEVGDKLADAVIAEDTTAYDLAPAYRSARS